MGFCEQCTDPSCSTEFLDYLSVEYQEGLGSIKLSVHDLFYDDVSIQSKQRRMVGPSADNELQGMWKEAVMF